MSIKYKNNSDEVINNLRKAIDNAGSEIGITLVADVKSNTPVDTGKLKKSYSFKKDIKPLGVRIIVGSNIYYAPWVEFKAKNKGGRPHLRATLRNNTTNYKNIFERHLRGL